YYAHNFNEYEVEPIDLKKLSEKDLLLNEIKAQLERSEQIVNAFSTNEIISDEDSRIINKHKDLVSYFERLNQDVMLINENNLYLINEKMNMLQEKNSIDFLQ